MDRASRREYNAPKETDPARKHKIESALGETALTEAERRELMIRKRKLDILKSAYVIKDEEREKGLEKLTSEMLDIMFGIVPEIMTKRRKQLVGGAKTKLEDNLTRLGQWLDGKTEKEVAASVGVNVSTMSSWLISFPNQIGKIVKWEDMTEALEKEGIDTTEIKPLGPMDPLRNKIPMPDEQRDGVTYKVFRLPSGYGDDGPLVSDLLSDDQEARIAEALERQDFDEK